MSALMAGMIPVMVILMSRDTRAMEPTSVRFWGVMSLATIVGGALAYPVNWWLVATGLKRGMGSSRALGRGGHDPATELPSATASGRARAVATAIALLMLFVGLALAIGMGDDPDLNDELGGGLINDGGQGLFVVGDLVVEVGDPRDDSPHGVPGV
jgi:hypothetical protein